MNFRYLRYHEPGGPLIRVPVLPIRLTRNHKHADLFALVDSGSDVCMFHSSIARILGIEMKTDSPEEIYGISDQPITVYFHQVHLTVIGLSSVDIRVGFTDAAGVAQGVVGQRGFFDNYLIKFERYRDQIEVFPKSTAF
jgi:hypothetical protein